MIYIMSDGRGDICSDVTVTTGGFFPYVMMFKKKMQSFRYFVSNFLTYCVISCTDFVNEDIYCVILRTCILFKAKM